jgi:hypothetical protein
LCKSPTPYSTSSVGNLLQKFAGGSEDKDFKPAIFKKRSAPKPPSDFGEERPPWMNNKKGPAPPRPSSKNDPIREMESMGRKPSDEVRIILVLS